MAKLAMKYWWLKGKCNVLINKWNQNNSNLKCWKNRKYKLTQLDTKILSLTQTNTFWLWVVIRNDKKYFTCSKAEIKKCWWFLCEQWIAVPWQQKLYKVLVWCALFIRGVTLYALWGKHLIVSNLISRTIV